MLNVLRKQTSPHKFKSQRATDVTLKLIPSKILNGGAPKESGDDDVSVSVTHLARDETRDVFDAATVGGFGRLASANES